MPSSSPHKPQDFACRDRDDWDRQVAFLRQQVAQGVRLSAVWNPRREVLQSGRFTSEPCRYRYDAD